MKRFLAKQVFVFFFVMLGGIIPVSVANADQNVSIGVYTANNIRFFNGLIDDVRVYDEALSKGKIQAMMNE